MRFKSLFLLISVLISGCAVTGQHISLDHAPASPALETGDEPASGNTQAGMDNTASPEAAQGPAQAVPFAVPSLDPAPKSEANDTASKAANHAKTWVLTPQDKTLQSGLSRWAAAAGWQLSWELSVDYPITTRTEISGTFDEALEIVAKSLARSEVPIKVFAYEGNKVIRVVAKGGE
ncbi:MAG TPA: toxin co-regulated pilus biosynthesis Q family protein [Noviherbaspirillum sp.]|nr:toxin co-regulated pilus biosynthesis Q family protein [Noviherbaspirillum sp.]